MHRNWPVLACALIFVLGTSGAALAQTPLHTVPRVQDFFSPIATEVDAGTQPRLTLRPTDAANKLLGEPLKVRVFALAAGQDRPSRSGSRGNCDVFVSSTYPVRAVGKTLELMPTSENWLDASTLENLVRSGRFLVVLESASDSHGDFLLLDRDHQNAYFSSGFVLSVKPTAQTPREQILAAFKARRKALEAVELEVVQKLAGLTCFGFKRLVLSQPEELMHLVHTCHSESDPTPG